MTSTGVDPDPDPVIERRRAERRYVPGTTWESKVPRIASWVCYFTAAVSLITTFFPGSRRFLAPARYMLDILFVGTPTNLAWAVLMVILASALGKRQRAAWGLLLALELFEVFFLTVIFFSFDVQFPVIVVQLIVDLIVIGILLLARTEFFAIAQKGNGYRAVATFIIGVVITLAVGAVLVSIVGTPEDRLQRIPVVTSELFDALGAAPGTNQTHQSRVLTFTVSVLGSLTFIATTIVLFRPRQKDHTLTGEEEVRLRELLDEYGEQDSLGYFATRRDKSVVWAPSGRAAVTYRVVLGTSVASADPIGDPAAWPAAIEAWLEDAHLHAWAPAVMGASERGAQAYGRAGLGAMELGDEAILQFRDFQLSGRYMRAVRQAVNRVERAGYTAKVRRHFDLSEEEMALAIAAADEWRDTDTERGFSMALGRMGDPLDGTSVLVEAIDRDGTLQALLNFSPWGEHGLSLDLMRRSRTSENGVIEFMVANLVEAGPMIGVDHLSLNFAVMRGVFEEGSKIGAGPVIRTSRKFLVFASRWFQLESLYLSNQKYDPDWVPRYQMFENGGDLPRVGLASAVVEGFVALPNFRGWFRRSTGPKASPLIAGCAGSPVELMRQYEDRRDAAAEAARLAEAENAKAGLIAGMPEQERVRRMKLTEMRDHGIDPYATSFNPNITIGAVRSKYGDLPPDSKTGEQVSVAGRLMLNRIGGKLCFATIRDWSGDLQLMISLNEAGEDALKHWKSWVDLGDMIGATGEVITSKRGELSVLVSSFVVTSKCLVPLPDKHKGLNDPEARVRQRYVDLIVNSSSRDMLELRSHAIQTVREQMWSRGFLEVETPMLQPVHGGANARPFLTHINAYDMRLYLRIAPELFLKRLLVGGAEKVFELNRNFRNEGADATHNPEFTSMEMYDAYGNYDTMRVLTRELILEAAVAVHGKPIVLRPRTKNPDDGFDEVDISGEWPVITVLDAVSAAVGEEVNLETDMAQLAKICERMNVPRDPNWDAAHLILELYDEFVEGPTTKPVFYTDFPTAVSPLTRKKPSNPLLAERWDLVAWGAELGTAYTELIDPIDQRERFTAQSLLAAAGDVEAMEIDNDFLRALEYGMPPTGGQGMGIDRLIMLLTGRNIRETILFPITRPDQA
ncbi:MAG: bifunctional lysylphosphatidylglycerol synthetase/lysine--tRNA ligase LysX [Actinomycetes bacterium]